MKIIIKQALTLGLLVLFLPTRIVAHSLDETTLNVFLFTNNERKLLQDNQIQLELFVSWPQLSYIHEKYSSKRIAAKNFDEQLSYLKQNPDYYRSYISENLEVKTGENDCDLEKFEEKEIDKTEVLVGQGFSLLMLFKCPERVVTPVSIINRIFLDEFGHQVHVINFYSYNKLVKNEDINKDKLVAIYPDIDLDQPKKIEANEKKTVKNSVSTWILLGCLGLLGILVIRKKKKI